MSEESFFDKLGSVVGIGVGELDLMLVKNAFSLGETVHGRLVLKLKRKVEGKRLVAGIEALEERFSLVSDGRGGRRQQRDTVVAHRFEQQLDGQRGDYLAQAYDLHLPLPGAPAKVELPQGVLGDVARFVNAVAGKGQPLLQWRVFAFIEVPWKANIKAAADIAVR